MSETLEQRALRIARLLFTKKQLDELTHETGPYDITKADYELVRFVACVEAEFAAEYVDPLKTTVPASSLRRAKEFAGRQESSPDATQARREDDASPANLEPVAWAEQATRNEQRRWELAQKALELAMIVKNELLPILESSGSIKASRHLEICMLVYRIEQMCPNDMPLIQKASHEVVRDMWIDLLPGCVVVPEALLHSAATAFDVIKNYCDAPHWNVDRKDRIRQLANSGADEIKAALAAAKEGK